MKILILGMGNPILSDDGIGLRLAERLQKKIRGADVQMNAMVGLNLLDQIIGYDRIFIIDAMTSPGGHIGEMRVITETNGLGSFHLFSSHGINIFDLMDLGKRCGYEVPELAAVYGIEIGNDVAFGKELSLCLQRCLNSLEDTIISDMLGREPSLETIPRRPLPHSCKTGSPAHGSSMSRG